MYRRNSLRAIFVFSLLSVFLLISLYAANIPKKALTFQDIMKFKDIENPVISEDGLWLAYSLQPDRGDGEAQVHGLKTEKVFSIERGTSPVISKDSRWVAVIVKPKAEEMEKAEKEKPKQGMALLETMTGNIIQFEKIESFAFSDDSKWLACLQFKEEEKLEKKEKKELEEKPETKPVQEKDKKKEKVGSMLIIRSLDSGSETKIPYVLSFAFDSTSRYLAFVVAEPEGKGNGLFLLELDQEGLPKKTVAQEVKGIYSSLAWTRKGSRLAFLAGTLEKDKEGSGSFSFWLWDSKTKKSVQAVSMKDIPEGWIIPEKNNIRWTRDGKRAFFGLKPEKYQDVGKDEGEGKEEQKEIDLFDIDKILEKREVDVWHWNDPFIIPHQKKMWSRLKDQTFLSVYHFDSNRFVQLADEEMPTAQYSENPHFVLGFSDVPYRKKVTWYGGLDDVYIVNLQDGSRKKVVSELEDRSSLSPNGRYVVFYKEKHWHLFDGNTGIVRNLTQDVKVPFFDEDHDYPSKVPGYGIASWMENDKAVLIYDKYDIWKFSVNAGEAVNITDGQGRKSQITFRILRLDPEELFFKTGEQLLLSSYNDLEKNYSFYTCSIDKPGVKRLLEEKKRFRFLGKAKNADVLMYTRENFDEFPDIWVSDRKLSSPRKVTNANPQISDFAWGSPELVEWNSMDGIPLQGVLIKPANYEPGKRYPVIVYFYRFFSQRLYEFNQMVVNHRPNFPFYTSNGYAIFLPDIRFEVGHPGFSSTKCLVPGVQKLIDMGIADPKAIGLHGHSWSGYQTAFVITQTDIFTCAVAGAPVSNMTSAYSGIRWESGLARQFQYEQAQSRIGGSLWDYPERYIENSPVFFADRIKIPLLIMFGDEDGAVPWYQGIELYLAMRRLGKDCVFLQYRGEPHHPQKYPNKLDYSIKMKQYFDHYLKGLPAPEWITKGIPYQGK